MNVIVVAMVVAVVLSITFEYSEAIDGDITSEELCQEIKSNQRRILTMGSRGKSQEDAHFYMLVTGGYMFRVPLANLHVDHIKKTTSLTIDQNYIRANELLNVNASLFTTSNRFFLISNRKKDAFLGRMFPSLRKSSFQLFNLTGVRSPLQDHPQVIDELFYDAGNVFGNIGIDSFSTYAFQLSDKILKRNLLETDNKADKLIWKKEWAYFGKYMMNFYSNTPLVTVFYHKDNPNKEAGYYFFLDADGLITVTRRENAFAYQWLGKPISKLYSHRFEVKLSAFMVCDFQVDATKSDTQRVTQSSPNWIDQTTNATAQTGPPGTYLPYWAIPLGIGTILVLGGIALYWIKRRHRKKNKKNKNKPQDDSVLSSLGSSNIPSNLNSSNLNSSNISSNASSWSSSFAFVSNPSSTASSLASSTSSALQSVKSKIASLLKGNRSKLAKAVTKEKNSKVKSKKPKKSKVNKDKLPKSP